MILLEQIVRDVVVGVAFEVGFVCFVCFKINLRVLEDPKRIFESARNLLVNEIKIVCCYIELL